MQDMKDHFQLPSATCHDTVYSIHLKILGRNIFTCEICGKEKTFPEDLDSLLRNYSWQQSWRPCSNVRAGSLAALWKRCRARNNNTKATWSQQGCGFSWRVEETCRSALKKGTLGQTQHNHTQPQYTRIIYKTHGSLVVGQIY